jgi:hypothetical protein
VRHLRQRFMTSCMVALLVAPFLVLGSASPAHAFCVEKFLVISWYCTEQGHDTITDEALDFVSPSLRSRIKDKNTDQDGEGTEADPELHFTNCLFTKSTDYIRNQYDQLISAVRPSPIPIPTDTALATMRWGQLLHPVQDFYSHSPWVDPIPVGLGFGTTYPRRLLDSGLGNWRRLGPYEKLFPADPLHSDIVTVQGNLFGIIDLPRDQSGNPKSAVPNVWPFYSDRQRGLMTASSSPFTNGDGQCPPPGQAPGATPWFEPTCIDNQSVCIRHGGSRCSDPIFQNCLHHDVDSRPHWKAAFDSAVAQTEHEWCRLLHMTSNRGSFDAASVLMALWVARDDRPGATPHPAGTPCAPERKRGVAVRLTVAVEALQQPDWPNLSFVAYTGDFRQSVRVLIRSDNGVENLNICMNDGDSLLTTLWGWSDKHPALFGGQFGVFDLEETVLKGTTREFPGPILMGMEQVTTTPDLRLKVTLSPDPSPSCPT